MSVDFRTRRHIEFVDTDLAGFVHFSRFFIFMETAEHEFLRSLGASVHMKYRGKDIGWPRIKVSCEYFKPVRFEEELDIHMSVARKGKKSMTYDFSFLRDGELIAKGQVTAACCLVTSGSTLRAIEIPEFIAKKIDA